MSLAFASTDHNLQELLGHINYQSSAHNISFLQHLLFMQSARASITMPITRAIRSVLHRNSPTPNANYTKKRYANLYNEITLVSENITFPLPVQYKEVYLHCRTKMLSQTIVGNTIFMIISITISLFSSLGNRSKSPLILRNCSICKALGCPFMMMNVFGILQSMITPSS